MTAVNNTSLRPFRLHTPDTDLDDLHNRLARTRWASDSPAGGWSRRVPVAYLQGLADHRRRRCPPPVWR